jgi:hypothetical protein
MIAPAFLVCVNAVVRKRSILVRKFGLLFGGFLDSFLPPSHRSLTRAFALTLTLTLTLTMTVFRALTFWSSSIFIWHINHLLPACERKVKLTGANPES